MSARESEYPRIETILDAIRAITTETGEPVAPKQIVEETGLERENVQSGLALALEMGLVKKPRYGRYALSSMPVIGSERAERTDLHRSLPSARAGVPLHSVIPLLTIEVGGKIHTQAELVIRSTGQEAKVSVGS